MKEVTVFSDTCELARGAAELTATLAREAVATRGRFTLALAGGGTPRPVHQRLASAPFAEAIAWDRTRIFFGDERCVPPDDPRSNYRMARETLLDLVPLPPASVHRISGEEDPAAAAAAYEQTLRSNLEDGAPPILDLVFLGMGDNGHTASLFPGTEVLHESRRLVAAQYVEEIAAWRVTMTPVMLYAARHVVFLVSGEAKASMLQSVLDGPYQPEIRPAQLLRNARGRVHWLVDSAAAGQMK